jgi:molecular chaperone DnaK (HSP70)
MVLNYVQVVEGSNGTVKIVSSNAGKEFAAEEISAQVLRKLVDDASKFLNDKVVNNDLPISSSSVRHGPNIRTL